MMIRNYFKLFLVLAFTAVTFSCDAENQFDQKRSEGYKTLPKRDDNWFTPNPEDKIDPYGNLSRGDYQGIINTDRKYLPDPSTAKLKMPDVADLVENPDEQKLVNDKLVSISVNESVPLKDVIIELARRAEVDVEIDKDIDGGIIFIAKDKPFSEVIDRICEMANLRYSFKDGILRIEKDKPVVKNYKFNLLDMTRSSQSSINTSFTVGQSSGSGSSNSGSNSSSSNNSTGGGSFGGGSNSSLNAKSGDGDIWASLTSGIDKILTNYHNPASSAAATVNPDGSTAAAPAGTVASSIISMNKNAGIISILATEKQHAAVKEYLDRMHIELTSQVLIEARVVEVNLNDTFKSGINWNLLNGTDVGVSGGFGASAPAVARAATNAGFKFSVLPQELFDETTIDASIELLQTFGTTRSLSNPRINALNNQFAVLNFSKNEVYFEVEQNDTTTTGTATTTQSNVKTTIRSVPIGIVLTLQPSIDLQKNEILMNVRPTLTRVTDRVDDPGAKLIAAGIPGFDLSSFKSQIPVVDTREIDTTLRIKNGEIMVIGGMLEERAENTDTGLPGLSRIPVLGNAFKGVNKTTANVETVVFIKATIVPGKGVTVEDEDFYKKFTTSRSKFMPNPY